MAMRTKEEIMAVPSNPHDTNKVEVLIDIRDALVEIAYLLSPEAEEQPTAGTVTHEDVPQDGVKVDE
jgi:hypothetical protein